MKNLLLIFGLFIALPGPCSARTLEVGPQQPFASLGLALQMAVDGDRIVVHPGVYFEYNLLIDKSVHLQGIDYPALDGQGKGEILTIVADSVTVEGFEIRNVGSSYLEDRAGIRLRRAKDFVVRGNRLYNTFFGIYLEHAGPGKVHDNEIIGRAEEEMSSGNAIHLWYCEGVQIECNLVRGHRDGIYLEFADHSVIAHNVSEDNLRYGLHFMFSNDDEYHHNEFRRNGAGVAVMFSRRIAMYGNAFEFNWGRASYGLLLKEIYDADIHHNRFRENTIGIYVEGSARIRYLNNDLERNGWALKMSGGCLSNTLSENNFLGNTFDLSMNSAPGDNTFDGNYWSEYSGYDLDRDGRGDVPHQPVKLFNYVVNRTPESIVLLRSLFVDLLNFSEKVSPVFSPPGVVDHRPFMKKIKRNP